MTFEEFYFNNASFTKNLEKLIQDIFQVRQPMEGDPIDPNIPDDTLSTFADIGDYLLLRYASFDCLYEDAIIMDRLLTAQLKTNALEFAKVITVWRSAKLEYEKLLIGDNANNTSSISYSGLNASGAYTTTTNDAKSVNVFNSLSNMVNRSQSEVYLFIDRIIQPFLRITY